jgi:hypothetical protein
MQSFISNLKHQSPLTVILAALAGYVATYIWSYIPFVSKIFYGDIAGPTALVPFTVTLWYFVNPLLNTIALAMLLDQKGARHGFSLGLIVTLFFSGTAYLASTFGTGQPLIPALTLVMFIWNLLFYAVPSTLLGHLRKS